MSNFVICQQRVKVVEYLAQMARVASNNRFKFSYAHDVLLPEVSPEVPCMCHIPVEPCAVEVLKLGWKWLISTELVTEVRIMAFKSFPAGNDQNNCKIWGYITSGSTQPTLVLSLYMFVASPRVFLCSSTVCYMLVIVAVIILSCFPYSINVVILTCRIVQTRGRICIIHVCCHMSQSAVLFMLHEELMLTGGYRQRKGLTSSLLFHWERFLK